MDKFEGKCVGGPYDGNLFVHWQNTQKIYRPMVGWSMNMANAPIEPVEIGEYRLNDFGYWHWWPTAEGKAFETLYGPAVSKGTGA